MIQRNSSSSDDADANITPCVRAVAPFLFISTSGPVERRRGKIATSPPPSMPVAQKMIMMKGSIFCMLGLAAKKNKSVVFGASSSYAIEVGK